MNTTTATEPLRATLQVRVDAETKQKAAEICAELGTNLSTVTNMLLQQIVSKKTIPFRLDVGTSPYSASERIKQTAATMAFEDLEFDSEDIQDLMDFELARVSREELIEKYRREALAE